MKGTATWLKYLKYLGWLGLGLVIAGLTAGVISGTWTPIPLAIALAGGVVIAGWLIYLAWGQQGAAGQPGFWGRRSTQAGTNALVSTLAVLVILGVINFLAVRYPVRLDLTENQVFTLAPESQQLVRNLKQPVKVWVFDRQQNPQDRELLTNYSRLNSQLNFEYVDPQANPSLAKQFGVKSFGDVYLELPPGKRQQFVQRLSQQERLSETKLTNALEQISRDRPVTVYFLQGHGERPIQAREEGAMTEAVQGLENKNYTVKPLNLAEKAELPADADVIVLAGPQKALLQPEVKALEAYLKEGGNLLLLVDPETQPGLDPLLQAWGVTLDPRVAIDASGKIANLGPAEAIVTQYGQHPITQDFGSNFSFYPFARPIQIKAVSGVQATKLLETSERSWAESNLKQQPLKFDPKSDTQGPLTLGVALTRPAEPVTPNRKEARLVVVGNSSFATDGLFNQLLNGDVFLNSVRWLSQQDQQSLSIRPKEAKNRRITLSAAQASLAGWLALVLLPLAAFVTAAIVWWRRR